MKVLAIVRCYKLNGQQAPVVQRTGNSIQRITCYPVASHADVLGGSSSVPAPRTGTRDEPLRTSAWEASYPADEMCWLDYIYPLDSDLSTG